MKAFFTSNPTRFQRRLQVSIMEKEAIFLMEVNILEFEAKQRFYHDYDKKTVCL